MTRKIRNEMNTDLITIGWGERMKRAHDRMRSHGIRHLPVTDESGAIVGILSDRDVSRAMVSRIDHGRPGLPMESLEFEPNAHVRDYMSWPVEIFAAETAIRVVAQKMIRSKISAILVEENSRIVGIVTSEDLLRVLVDLLTDDDRTLRMNLGCVLRSSESALELA